MRTDREMTALFSGALVDESPDPTFLDELFALLVEEVAANRLDVPAARAPRAGWWRGPAIRWPVAIAASLAIVLVGLGLLLRPIGQVGGPSPTPSAPPSRTSPTPIPPATPLATQPVVPSSVLTTFRSAKYQYTIGYPKNWNASTSPGTLSSLAYPYDFTAGVDYFSATAPTVSDPGLIIAGPTDIPVGTTLDSWITTIQQLQATSVSCPFADATQDLAIGGQPGRLLTWNSCPAYLLWAGVVRGARAYHVILIDRYAVGNPALEASDKTLFLKILASLRFTGPTPSPSP
jgi:hypothetical protein